MIVRRRLGEKKSSRPDAEVERGDIARRRLQCCNDVRAHPGRRLTRLTFGQPRNIDARYRSPLHFLELWSITAVLSRLAWVHDYRPLAAADRDNLPTVYLLRKRSLASNSGPLSTLAGVPLSLCVQPNRIFWFLSFFFFFRFFFGKNGLIWELFVGCRFHSEALSSSITFNRRFGILDIKIILKLRENVYIQRNSFIFTLRKHPRNLTLERRKKRKKKYTSLPLYHILLRNNPTILEHRSLGVPNPLACTTAEFSSRFRDRGERLKRDCAT